ncbi:hypothetical protein [Aquabacterium humicola]|uniref:hypothetical protein n=1 Tax=Aquabacterium humicola TaxID=3237377 RepID=UPI0025433CDA|nr:hypothetical protein [Rubrivivax pictus]
MIDTTRRALLRTGGALPAAWTAAFAGAAALLPAEASAANGLPRLWRSADVLIGQSPEDQAPALAISCPLYYPNGQPARASHALDLGRFPVYGDISWDGQTVVPDFGASTAVGVTQGSDGQFYLLAGLEGPVSGGTGRFAGVTRAIARCKYKVVPTSGMPLLVACVSCVVILVQE